MKNRIGTGFIILVTLLLTVFSAQAGSKYVGIQELRENTPAKWKETIIGGKKKMECVIDAPIVVPNVDRFPVLQVVNQGWIPDLENKGYYIEDDYSEWDALVKTVPDKALKDVKFTEEINLHEESLDEETIAQAEEKARNIIRKIWDLNGTELECHGVCICRDTGSSFYDTTVDFYPIYNGIAYLNCPHSGYVIKNMVRRPFNSVYAFWRDDIEYEGASFCIPRVTGEYVSDVPLVPFEKIQKTLRQYTEKGYIHSIHEIRLGYICLNDPEHPGENFYLTPGWVVCGVTNSEPNIPFYPQEYHFDLRYNSNFVIDAQTGELFDLNAQRKEIYDAHILTWNDVH